MLRFYRLELSKRGWSENDGAVVEPGGAVIAFTTSDGPALLRLTHQDDRTIADLSLRKPVAMDAATDAAIQPVPGQVRLLFGNATDEEAVITINEQTIKLAARAELKDDLATGRKSPEGQEINLPPGKYKASLKLADGAAQNREFEVAADETWGLVAGPAGVPCTFIDARKSESGQRFQLGCVPMRQCSIFRAGVAIHPASCRDVCGTGE